VKIPEEDNITIEITEDPPETMIVIMIEIIAMKTDRLMIDLKDNINKKEKILEENVNLSNGPKSLTLNQDKTEFPLMSR
jgi:hypothetical protein